MDEPDSEMEAGKRHGDGLRRGDKVSRRTRIPVWQSGQRMFGGDAGTAADLPDGGRNESKETRLFQTGTELGAEDLRQSGIGNEKAWMFGIHPGIIIRSEAAGGDEHAVAERVSACLPVHRRLE